MLAALNKFFESDVWRSPGMAFLSMFAAALTAGTTLARITGDGELGYAGGATVFTFLGSLLVIVRFALKEHRE